jgi:hypothetical protein
VIIVLFVIFILSWRQLDGNNDGPVIIVIRGDVQEEQFPVSYAGLRLDGLPKGGDVGGVTKRVATATISPCPECGGVTIVYRLPDGEVVAVAHTNLPMEATGPLDLVAPKEGHDEELPSTEEGEETPLDEVRFVDPLTKEKLL